MKEFADDNFGFDENGRKFSQRVENTAEKGEIARYDLWFKRLNHKSTEQETRLNHKPTES